MGSSMFWLAWHRGGLPSPWGSLGRAADITLPIGTSEASFVLVNLVGAHLACSNFLCRTMCIDLQSHFAAMT